MGLLVLPPVATCCPVAVELPPSRLVHHSARFPSRAGNGMWNLFSSRLAEQKHAAVMAHLYQKRYGKALVRKSCIVRCLCSGVRIYMPAGKWVAVMRKRGEAGPFHMKQVHLGRYATEEEVDLATPDPGKITC